MKKYFDLKNTTHQHWLILIGLSFITRFIFFGYPQEIVFDEVTFGKFMQSIWKGEYYFDLHPPLGKLILYFGYMIGQPNIQFVYDKIGTEYADSTFLIMRFLTTFAGFFVPLFAYSIMTSLQKSQFIAFITALLLIFENSSIVISRFFMFDVFLLFFMFGTLALYLKFKLKTYESNQFTKNNWWCWIAISIMASATFSIKWTGASILGFILFYEWMESYKKSNWSYFVKKVSVFGLCFFVFYYLQFVVHFSMLTKSGMGDDFMTPQFQKGLAQSKFEHYPQLEELSGFQKFIELNQMMIAYHKTMHQSHPYSSTALDWLTMKRPIYYWEKGPIENKARIYSLGNPMVWWLGAISIFIALQKILIGARQNLLNFFEKAVELKKSKKKKNENEQNLLEQKNYLKWNTELVLFVLFAVNFVPFFLIGRVMFIYHYMPALTVSVLTLGYFAGQYLENNSKKWILTGVFLICVVSLYLFFSPLTYGFELSNSEYKLRIWLESWI